MSKLPVVSLNNNSILVCGGAGFIGSHFVKVVKKKYPDCLVVVLDSLTYAGNLSNLPDDIHVINKQIQDRIYLAQLFKEKGAPDYIVNFAAETHNDRSITNPGSFIETNVEGVGVLCDLARDFNIKKFVHVSTDEVGGSFEKGSFKESDPLNPKTPYSASKAGGELIALAHHNTFDTSICITRGGNTYGPNQYPEKLIPFFITRLLEDKKIPVYGTGNAVREWIHVEDHAEGILAVLEKGIPGEIYNIGDNNERTNNEIIDILLKELKKDKSLVKNVEDPRKKAHDQRYSLDLSKIKKELNWEPTRNFEEELSKTIKWYVDNPQWWKEIQQTLEYQEFYNKFYKPLLGE